MAEYHKVRIGTIYLTKDGTDATAGCRVLVGGLDALQLGYVGNVVRAADNTPYLHRIENDGRGKDLTFDIFVLNQEQLEDIRTEWNGLIAAKAPIPVLIEDGPFGDFAFNCLPTMPQAITFSGEFSNERIPGIVIRLTILEPLEIEEEEE